MIKKKNKALEALSGIDVQMKMRFELIPNILAIAKKFMEHEKGLITQVTELRVRASAEYNKNNPDELKEHINAIDEMNSKMRQFMLNVENYPQLKSDQTMVQAMQSYNEVEAQISAARRFYNSAVGEVNNSIEIFPGSIIARMASIGVMPFFRAESDEKEPVDATKLLN